MMNRASALMECSSSLSSSFLLLRSSAAKSTVNADYTYSKHEQQENKGQSRTTSVRWHSRVGLRLWTTSVTDSINFSLIRSTTENPTDSHSFLQKESHDTKRSDADNVQSCEAKGKTVTRRFAVSQQEQRIGTRDSRSFADQYGTAGRLTSDRVDMTGS